MLIRCARCGARFPCSPGGECWCMKPPFLPLPVDASATCLCPACLREAGKALPTPTPA